MFIYLVSCYDLYYRSLTLDSVCETILMRFNGFIEDFLIRLYSQLPVHVYSLSSHPVTVRDQFWSKYFSYFCFLSLMKTRSLKLTGKFSQIVGFFTRLYFAIGLKRAEISWKRVCDVASKLLLFQ